MKIRLNASVPFDLRFTLCCGQAFRWDKQGEWWYGVAGEHVLKIRQISNVLEFENTDARFVRNYFGLNDDLLGIFSQSCCYLRSEAFQKPSPLGGCQFPL